MAEGFLKGIWGKPATQGSGMMGLWSSITKAPRSIMGAMMTPFKIMAYIIVIIVGVILYSRIK